MFPLCFCVDCSNFVVPPAEAAAALAAPPAVYIFGDSTLDVGTNDFIPGCLARADFYFNGIDFPHSRPTGRFSNGLNTADQIAILLRLTKSPPPFLYLVNAPSTFQEKIVQGANYASGGSSILNYTGQVKRAISLEDQIKQFSAISSNITNMTGSEEATDMILSKAFFLISIGSNDILEYLLNPTPPMSVLEFNATLISTYAFNRSPIGCTPFARAVFTGINSCFEPAQELALEFSLSMMIVLDNFSSQVQDMKYSMANTFLMTSFFMGDMLAFGFKNIAAACCGNGTYDCNQMASFCLNPDEYLFWDRFHPTQRASELAALTLFGASEPLVAPMNFSRLLGVKYRITDESCISTLHCF
ncbi:UPF0548 protein [Hibiscus syriacus]|uniref:UPF0548 protein n=1 Tax=Hibiscus syriacus TaxID=106335 RepID=A0A6A3B046_HIBSY|nr:UPF0548 protein [Hibiscus syriacus]